MRQKNDTENMLILLDKSMLHSHWQYAVQFVTLFKGEKKEKWFQR